MVMPPRRSSSGMQSIRRELQRRRPKPLAPKSSAAKKPSAPPPPPPPRYGAHCTGMEPRPLPPCVGGGCTSREPRPLPPSQEDPSSTAPKSPPSSAATHAPRPHPSPRPSVISPSTPPPPRSAPSSAGSACPSTLGGTDEHLRPGTAVGVRTRTTKLKSGEVLVLWLRAMVVSRTHGGYEVVYDGDCPPGDPYGTVRVPRRHVRMIDRTPSPPSQKPTSCAPSPCASDTTATVAAARKKETRPAPRPTRAGKSLRLIRSLLPEMERQARADFHGY